MSSILDKIDTYLNEKSVNEGMSSLTDFSDDIQILRACIWAECDASNFYLQAAEKASSLEVKRLLIDIAKEEDVHTYEFKNMLEKIYPGIDKIKDKANKEAEEMFGKN